MKKNILLILSIIISIFTITACSNTDTNRIIRISETGTYASATSQIMKEKGFLEKYLPEDVKIEWNTIATGPDIRDAIISEKIDVATIGLMPYISAYENDLPLTIISFSGSSPINIYSNRTDVKKLSDFDKDAHIAITNKATILHMAFLAYSKDTLGDAMIYDNCLSPITGADALASLQSSNNYDGAVFIFPMTAKANQIETLTLIADMSDVINEYGIGNVYVAHSTYAQKNPDIIEAVKKAQNETLDYILQNLDECGEILSKLYNIEKDTVIEVLQKMPPKKEIRGYDKQADLMYQVGILDKKATKFIDIPNYENIPK